MASPSTPERAALRAQLAAHREAQLQRLHAYAVAGQFPHNFGDAAEQHIFGDEAGRLCAVANLVHQDGRDDLVDATVREENDLAIADVRSGALRGWMLSSGLTQEELVRIQAPAPRVERTPVLQRPLVAEARPHAARAQAITEAQLQAALRAHVATVEAELRAATAASLELAVDRALAVRTKS